MLYGAKGIGSYKCPPAHAACLYHASFGTDLTLEPAVAEAANGPSPAVGESGPAGCLGACPFASLASVQGLRIKRVGRADGGRRSERGRDPALAVELPRKGLEADAGALCTQMQGQGERQVKAGKPGPQRVGDGKHVLAAIM